MYHILGAMQSAIDASVEQVAFPLLQQVTQYIHDMEDLLAKALSSHNSFSQGLFVYYEDMREKLKLAEFEMDAALKYSHV